jgi:plasmid stabilization system protein ParE
MLVKLRDEAQVDLLEGAWFYEKKNDGLGERFIGFVQAELLQLGDNYGIHERVFGLHRKLVDRFPFAIYYLVNKDFVDVVAILDCRRNPDDIESRLRNA